MISVITNTISGRYLVIGVEDESRLLDFQLQMIKSNPHPRLLAAEKRKLNGKLELYYPLGELMTLEEYAPEGLEPGDILWILEETLRCLQLSVHYLLSAHNFLLEARFVFLKPHQKAATLIYLPLSGEGDINSKLRELMKQLILTTKKGVTPQEAVLLKSLTDFLPNPAYCPEELRKLLLELRMPHLNRSPASSPGAGKKFYLFPAKAGQKETEQENSKEGNGEKKSCRSLNQRIVLFLGMQAGLILLAAYLLGFMQELRHPLLVYGLAVLALTAGNVLAIDRLLLRKKHSPAPESPGSGWYCQLVGKLAAEYSILRQETERQREK